MANDITTLAIELQSREAEKSLQTFNELLDAGSDKAKRMERMTIGVDVQSAVQELNTLRASYENIAKTAQSIHFDLGVDAIRPEMFTPQSAAQTADATVLEELKSFFKEASEEMRKQAEALNESMEKMGSGAERAGTSVRTAGESMRGAGVSAGEYASKLREVNAAKRDMEKLSAKADTDMLAAVEADKKAAEAKRNLAQAEIELKKVSDQLNATHTGGACDVMALAEKEDALKSEVHDLTEAYKKAQAEADKFGAKLDVSAGKADEARARYNQLKAELSGIPVPTGKATKKLDDFSVSARRAGTTVTKLARGFNAVAFAGGAAVPGLSKIGMAISMFSYSGPYVGAAIVGIGLLASHIKKLNEQSTIEAQIVRENAERAMRSVQSAKEFISASENDWNRLAELSKAGRLTDVQNREATAIIERLTEAYGDLGIEIDKTTGKLNGYATARETANAFDRARLRMQLVNANLTAKQAFDTAKDAKTIDKEIGPGIADGIRNIVKIGFDSETNAKSMQSALLQDFMEKLGEGGTSLEKQYDAIQHRIFNFTNQLANKGFVEIGDLQLSKENANNELKYLQDVLSKLDAALKAKRALEEFDTSPVEKYSKEVGKLAESVKDAESKFVTEDGTTRLKTAEETYLAQKARIEAINKEIESVSKISDQTITLDNGKQAGIHLKELELERSNLLEKTLTYEERITAEKDKQRKALNSAIDAEQMRINTIKSGYIVNQNGALVRQKTTDELAQDRTEDINTIISRISEIKGKGDSQTLEDLKELTSLRLDLANLQAEQLKYHEQIAASEKTTENARRGYVFNDNGAVVRRKTQEELAEEQRKELEAARARVQESTAGTLERAKAEEELTRLEIEAYNMRKKSAAETMMNEARASNSRLVQGVEARSMEALALEARTFQRDDNEKTILKDTKEVQTDIRDTVENIFSAVSGFGSALDTLNESLKPLY